MNYSHFSDETLLNLIAQEDSLAFESLYDRHSQTVFNLIMRIVNDRPVADEILQESFWQAWKKAGDYRGTGAGAAWLYRIARNKSLDEVRKRKRMPVTEGAKNSLYEDSHLPITEAALVSSLHESSRVEQQATKRFDRQQLSEALSSIPNEQRHCLELAYFEGYSQSQIANKLDLPLGTVKTRVRIGLEKLEHILRAVGYSEHNF